MGTSRNHIRSIGKLVALTAFAACAADEPPPNQSTAQSAVGGTPASLVGLYDSRAHLGSDLPDPMEDYVLLQQGGTAVGLPGTHHFGVTQSPVPLPPPHIPTNAIASVLTWSFQGGTLELRLLRPIFAPTGVQAASVPAQIWVGYLRGLFDVRRNADGTWSGDADVEAVQFIGGGPCLNGLSTLPCVTRHYTGTIDLIPIDPWDQTGQPHAL